MSDNPLDVAVMARTFCKDHSARFPYGIIVEAVKGVCIQCHVGQEVYVASLTAWSSMLCNPKVFRIDRMTVRQPSRMVEAGEGLP